MTALKPAIDLLLHNLAHADARLQIVGKGWKVQLGKDEQAAIRRLLSSHKREAE